MSNLFGRRAVVVGGGIGGLSAAGALAGYFEQVDVLERDRLAASAESRPGTSQDRHPHGLLAGGLKALGEIFPGFERDLAEAGAVSVGVAQDIRYERADVGVLPKRDFGLSILCASRPLIEFVLRRRAMAVANIALRPGCRVTEIVPSHEAAHGVRFDTGAGQSETLEADLVVDASGRGALTVALLDTLDWERPPVTEVGVDITYATAVMRIPASARPDWKLVLTQPASTSRAGDAVLVPIEDDRWIVTIVDRGSGPRLDNWESFHAALPRLITPTIYDALRHAKPLEGIRHYGFPRERLEAFRTPASPAPRSACRSPMRSAGSTRSTVRACRPLPSRPDYCRPCWDGRLPNPDPLAAAQAGFMAGVESVLQTPWSMSTSADLAFPKTRGERPANFDKGRAVRGRSFPCRCRRSGRPSCHDRSRQLLQPQDLFREPHIMERIEAASAKAVA